jgi:FkbM family methyltransferase
MLKKLVKYVLKKVGLDIHKYTPKPVLPLATLFSLYQVDTIFDIGANIGTSVTGFRAIGFQKKIVSFEPIQYLFSQMAVQAAKDQNWVIKNFALGDINEEVYINVSGGHAGASSILSMTSNVLENAPDQEVVRQEKIEVKTIDSIIDQYYPHGDNLFLKIDVQGYEKKVIEGAKNSLARVIGIKVEMSIVKNYEEEMLWTEMIQLLNDLGFRLVLIENGWSNSLTKELYQIDGIFFRTDRISS